MHLLRTRSAAKLVNKKTIGRICQSPLLTSLRVKQINSLSAAMISTDTNATSINYKMVSIWASNSLAIQHQLQGSALTLEPHRVIFQAEVTSIKTSFWHHRWTGLWSFGPLSPSKIPYLLSKMHKNISTTLNGALSTQASSLAVTVMASLRFGIWTVTQRHLLPRDRMPNALPLTASSGTRMEERLRLETQRASSLCGHWIRKSGNPKTMTLSNSSKWSKISFK